VIFLLCEEGKLPDSFWSLLLISLPSARV